MNFKSYAISRKLKNNSDLIKYLNEGVVPVEVIEKEFSEVFDLYKDDEAELLSDDYKEYLRKHVPVSFIPNSKGLDVTGNISDNVLEIIDNIHGVDKNEVVSGLVEDVVETVSPNRRFKVEGVLFSEELNNLQDRVLNHTKHLTELSTEKDIIDAVLSNVDSSENLEVEAHNEVNYHKVDPTTLEVTENSDNVQELSNVNSKKDVSNVVAATIGGAGVLAVAGSILTNKDEKNSVSIDDSEVLDNVETLKSEETEEGIVEEKIDDEKELRNEIWNSFVSNLAEKKMNERVAIKQDLAFAM